MRLRKNGKLDCCGLEVGYCYCSSRCDTLSSLCLANCNTCWSVKDKTRNGSFTCYISTTKCLINLNPCNPACTQFFYSRTSLIEKKTKQFIASVYVDHCGVNLSEQRKAALFGQLRLTHWLEHTGHACLQLAGIKSGHLLTSEQPTWLVMHSSTNNKYTVKNSGRSEWTLHAEYMDLHVYLVDTAYCCSTSVSKTL